MNRNELIAAAEAINAARNLGMVNINRMPTARLQRIVEIARIDAEIQANPRPVQIAQPCRGRTPQASWENIVIRPATIN